VVDVVQELRRVAGNISLEALIEKGGPVRQWLETYLPVADDCIETLDILRADRTPGFHAKRAESRLGELHGDFDAMVRLWESLLARSDDSAQVRRNLAGAYVARCGRDWKSVSVDELQKIAAMMHRNLTEDPRNTRDLRLWFQAYRRIPEFRSDHAIERMTYWANHHDSAEAQYYLYILYFLLWRSNPSTKVEHLALDNLRKSSEFARKDRVRPDYSYEWLAAEPVWCPLVNHHLLGPMQSRTTHGERTPLFKDTSLLARLTGFTVPGFERQGGEVKIAGSSALKAFFVPPPDLHAYKDENREVSFFLGFSYGEMRAWDVRDARSVQAPAEARPVPRQTGETVEKAPEPAANPATHPTSVPKVRAGSDGEFRAQAQKAVVRIVEDYERAGRRLPISDFGERLRSTFPLIREKIPVKAGYSNLTAMIQDNDAVRIVEQDGGTFLRLNPPR
jgi:hypothetical protein